MEDKVSTSKIIVEESNEITDLVRKIHGSKAERLVLTFTEQTDILVSPINLTLLQETAQREGKLLIAQIIQNPTGIRNAKIAGIKTIDTPSNPTENDWEEALEITKETKRKKIEKKKSVVNEEKEQDEENSFEKKVDSSLEKTPPKGYVDRRGIKSSKSFISIDQDLPPSKILHEDISSTQDIPVEGGLKVKKDRMKFLLSPLKKLKSVSKKKALKIALLVVGPLLFLILFGFLLYNQFATFARVRIFVESKPVEVEVVLDGKENIEEISFEDLVIPIKTEEETKSLSDSVNATGKAFKGEKATGVVTFTYNYGADCTSDTPTLKLEVGHTVKAGNYSYTVVSGDPIICNLQGDYQVIATEIGDEYNLSPLKYFTANGFPSEKLYGVNSNTFSGGSKEEYTVLSQQDIDTAVEQLSLTAIEEVKSQLRNVGSNWEIIEETIKSEVDKSSIKTDKKVGEEATIVNLDLTIKGTAIYYSTLGLVEGLTDLLREEAEEQDLFETEKGLELVLGDSIEKDISVESSTAGSIKIKIEAKSSVKPKVDKNELEEKLKGMKWEEGEEYINNLKYAQKDAEIIFNPQSFPSFLKRFPNRRGGVLFTIVELEVEE